MHSWYYVAVKPDTELAHPARAMPLRMSPTARNQEKDTIMAEFKMTEERHIKSPANAISLQPNEKPSAFIKRVLAASEGAD